VNSSLPKIDRKGGVIFAVLGIGGTVLLVLTGLLLLSVWRYGGTYSLQGALRKAWATLHLWGSVLIGAAAVAGFWLGSDRTIRVLGHLWFTEKPRNLLSSMLLWIGLLLTSLAAYWLLVIRAL
jgi:hypothetical protein